MIWVPLHPKKDATSYFRGIWFIQECTAILVLSHLRSEQFVPLVEPLFSIPRLCGLFTIGVPEPYSNDLCPVTSHVQRTTIHLHSVGQKCQLPYIINSMLNKQYLKIDSKIFMMLLHVTTEVFFYFFPCYFLHFCFHSSK